MKGTVIDSFATKRKAMERIKTGQEDLHSDHSMTITCPAVRYLLLGLFGRVDRAKLSKMSPFGIETHGDDQTGVNSRPDERKLCLRPSDTRLSFLTDYSVLFALHIVSLFIEWNLSNDRRPFHPGE
jgi:hypothetical protein